MAITGRYILYGVVPSEHDLGNQDLRESESQKIGGTIPLYGTDDEVEAMAIYKAGGFTRNDNWLAVTWAKDTEGGGTVGDAPEEASRWAP
jgi:hypothetical protein